MLSFSIGEAAGIGNVATGEVQAPGALGERWHRVVGTGRRRAVATGHLLVEHADPRSAWLRNSLRGAVGIALAIFVADLFDAQNAFWVVLGTLSVLRSNAVGTEGSVVSSLVGTAIGIAIGCGVSLVVGSLIWPRGAKALIRTCLGEAYEVGSRLVSDRVESALAGREPDLSDPVRLETAAAGGRLDVALRQYLEESSSDRIDASSFVALTACSARLMRSAHGFRMMVGMPWYEAPPTDLVPVVNGINVRVREWYAGLAAAIGQANELPEPEEPDDSFTTEVVAAIGRAGRGDGGLPPTLSAAWLVQSLEYLIALEGRVAFHADRLFADPAVKQHDLQAG